MTNNNKSFNEQASDLYDRHTKLVVALEEYRKALGNLEFEATTEEAKGILSIAHHFLMNGLQNSLYAQREAIIRAERIENNEK
jgi:hypothetical protein